MCVYQTGQAEEWKGNQKWLFRASWICFQFLLLDTQVPPVCLNVPLNWPRSWGGHRISKPKSSLSWAQSAICPYLFLYLPYSAALRIFFFFSGKERSKKKQRTGDLIRHNMWISQCGHRPLFHACLIDDNGSLKDYLIPNKSQSPPSNPLISWSTVSFFRSTPKYRQSHRASRNEPTIHSLGVRPQHAFPTVSSVTHFLEIFNGAKALLCHCSCCSPFRIPTLLSSHVKQCTCPLALQI